MILFKKEHVYSILNGTKTETRRCWKKPRAVIGSVHKAKLKMLSKDYFAILYINKVWQQNLLDITESQAWNEGGYTKPEYLKKWDEINPNIPSKSNPLVWVVEFKINK